MISEGGTKDRPYNAILEDLFPLSASYGVSVDKEMTVVNGRAHRDAAGPFYPLLMDAVLNLSRAERLLEEANHSA